MNNFIANISPLLAQIMKMQQSQFNPYSYIPSLHNRESEELSYLPNYYYPEERQYSPLELSIEELSPYKSAMQKLLQRESGGKYSAVNPLGYLGGYQFGAPALEDVGMINKGIGKLGNEALSNPENWAIPGGREAFLNNPTLQDLAMQKLMSLNEKRLRGMGIVNEQTPQSLLAKYLQAAHLGGIGGVRKMLSGKNPRDYFGTGVKEYFNL